MKNDLRHYQCEYYDSKAWIINIPEGKAVYIRKDHVTPGLPPCFTNGFDGPYRLFGYYYGQKDLLKIQDQSGNVMKQVNTEKVITTEEHYLLHLVDQNFQEMNMLNNQLLCRISIRSLTHSLQVRRVFT